MLNKYQKRILRHILNNKGQATRGRIAASVRVLVSYLDEQLTNPVISSFIEKNGNRFAIREDQKEQVSAALKAPDVEVDPYGIYKHAKKPTKQLLPEQIATLERIGAKLEMIVRKLLSTPT